MSSGRGLKNVHWSFSKSIRTNDPKDATRLVTAGVEELADDVGEAVRLDVVPLARVDRVRAVRRRDRGRTG